MKNNKEDWIHPDNNLGEVFVDITYDDAFDIQDGRVFRWTFPVYKVIDGVRTIIGNVEAEVGEMEEEERGIR